VLEVNPLVGLSVNVRRSVERTVILEPDCKTTSKLLALTTTDSTTALDPDTLRSILATLMTVSVVSVTSSNAAKLIIGAANKASSNVNKNFFIMNHGASAQN
jgi:hypothetical protein